MPHSSLVTEQEKLDRCFVSRNHRQIHREDHLV
jgi:hypothetical protein